MDEWDWDVVSTCECGVGSAVSLSIQLLYAVLATGAKFEARVSCTEAEMQNAARQETQ